MAAIDVTKKLLIYHTLYRLNLLPIGGYVKLEGERGSAGEQNLPGSYAHKPLRVKLAILLFQEFHGFLHTLNPTSKSVDQLYQLSC